MRSRTLAIGDIHGCSRALDSIIAALEPRENDVIVTLGDTVNRGTDSRGVIDRLIELEEQSTLISILGNHDEMFLRALSHPRTSDVGRVESFDAWLAMGGGATLASYGAVPDRYGEFTVDDLERVPAEHQAFLERCASYYETLTHIFVHAQYDRLLAMNEQPVRLLRWASIRDRLPGPHISGKRAITGHTSQKTGEVLNKGYLVCIDTYCYGGGWLTALDVETGELWQADRIGRGRTQTLKFE
jgi:serine/threonine protein phosphatase 1